MDNDIGTIVKFANQCKPPGCGSNQMKLAQPIQGPRPNWWQDIDKKTKKQIRSNLQSFWGGAHYSTVNQRLVTHFDPSLLGYLTSDDPIIFKTGADILLARTEEGKTRTLFLPRN